MSELKKIFYLGKNGVSSRDPTNEEKAIHEEYLAKQEKNRYSLDRSDAYLSIADQLDMIYWDSVNGTTNWKDHIESVKTQYPKPESED